MNIYLNQDCKIEATLKGFFKNDKINANLKFLNKKTIGKISYFDTSSTFYIYLEEKENCEFLKIFNNLKDFLSNSNHSFNIDIDSFKFDNSNIGQKAAIQASLFGVHNQYSLKTKSVPRKIAYNLITKNQEIITEFAKDKTIMEGVNICRDLNDAPPNICTPKWFVTAAKNLFEEFSNIKIYSLSKNECQKLDMNLFLSVNAGCLETEFLVIDYNGDENNLEKTAFIGKGVTFDTGGYDLKPLIGQRNERYDMCGAGTIVGAMYGIAKIQPKSNIIMIAPLTENRIGQNTTLNSSIVTSMNGLTVEVVSTDAEGRMIMADGLTYAIRELRATKLITIATLTGNMIAGLGKHWTGVMSQNEELYLKIKNSAKIANERLWRMPLSYENFDAMKASEYADLINTVKIKYNPPSNAAAFLQMFAEEKPFAHIDIAGSAYINDRSNGVMVKTIIEYAIKEGDLDGSK